jgi:hypothetical protein
LKYEGFTTPVLSAYVGISLPGMRETLTIVLCGKIAKHTGGIQIDADSLESDLGAAAVSASKKQPQRGCPPAGDVPGTLSALDIIMGSGNYLTAVVRLLGQARGLGPVIQAIEGGAPRWWCRRRAIPKARSADRSSWFESNRGHIAT